MKKIFYEKRGRRYYPVSEYDSNLIDGLPKGTHLVDVYPGGKSTRYNVDPNHAALIAAGRIAEEAMCQALRNASEIQPKTRALTPEQLAAWEHLIKVFGEDARCLSRASSRDIAEAGIRALQMEADKLMINASVRAAYDQFIMMCELSKDHSDAETR
ncbi:MAG: hypothetical protein EBU08_09660 [Micrococcales bacterium]|nr:hypothetical protein [Micrococcales bacterium]